MWYWKKFKGSVIHWFSPSSFKQNIKWRQLKQPHWLYNSFSCYESNILGSDLYWNNGYVLSDNYSTEDYFNNFVTTIPENTTLYFEKSSFPRNKLKLGPYKRTIKKEKADYIVIEKAARVINKDVNFILFSDSYDIFAISEQSLSTYFNNDLNNIFTSNCVNNKFNGSLQVLYEGRLRFIIDDANTLKNFKDGLYNKPFIIDNDLDRIINQYLPDPDLNAIKSIYEMITSPDSATIKLGSTLAAGFNISKWPLTFLCLLGTNDEWIKSYNGGNLSVVSQMRSTLNIKYAYGLGSVASIIDASKEKYSKEDIALAQDFVRTLPELKIFCKNSQPFYLEGLPFIPDEYKQ